MLRRYFRPVTGAETAARADPRFDQVIVVDWSASSRPTRGRDSIWIASERVGVPGVPHVANVSTRHAALDLLVELVTDGGVARRSLVAIDVSLGYPSGTAAALGLDGTPWSAMWDLLGAEIVDDDRNANNRFAVAASLNERFGGGPGPFWGAPATRASPTLTRTKVASDPVPTWRAVESVLRSSGHRPFSSWQLTGAGAVGSQSLLGIAALSDLRRRLRATEPGAVVHVWPFTSGLEPPVPHGRPDVVLAEVWPSMFDHRAVAEARGAVRDEAQVRTVAATLADLDVRGTLSSWFSPDLRPAATDDPVDVIVRRVVEEEGWTLGVGVVDGPDGPAR